MTQGETDSVERGVESVLYDLGVECDICELLLNVVAIRPVPDAYFTRLFVRLGPRDLVFTKYGVSILELS